MGIGLEGGAWGRGIFSAGYFTGRPRVGSAGWHYAWSAKGQCNMDWRKCRSRLTSQELRLTPTVNMGG